MGKEILGSLELNRAYQMDCLEGMKLIPDKSIDMILCDLPYGTTACKWDTVIPFEPLWEQYERVIKDNGAIVLTASQPFTTTLISSNLGLYKYSWVWEKSKGSNFTHAKNMPIKFHEDICVFSKAPIGHKVQLGERRMKYNPQGLIKVDKVWKRPKKYDSEHKLKRESHKLERVIEFTNYPTSILKFGNSDNRERMHPTQKPVSLFEYLIKTYTDENDIVLDNCLGSGTTAVACELNNRKWIGFETEGEYIEIINKRLDLIQTEDNLEDYEK
jgi:site-specific DNA-methyltransferase (adenine-specific)